jgi:ectoine hydroxylase-related dioxygenase (phytanoyl-CoA dioxygenase family)
MTDHPDGEVAMTIDTATDVPAALEALERDGYVVLRGVVPAEPLAEFAEHLASEFDRASASDRMFRGGGLEAGHLNCFPGEASRFIFEALQDRGVIDIVRAYRPEIVDRMRVTTNYNLPGSVVQHFHSDGLYTEAFLICNVAVVDTDLANGAIDVLPGTHQRFYKFWRYAAERKYRESTRVPLKQGDVLLRISTVWHRGMPNHTSDPRPMWSLTFGEVSAPEHDPFATFGGAVTFTPNWYGTGPVSRAREKTFVKMPWLYSTYRFTRSLVGNKGYSSW